MTISYESNFFRFWRRQWQGLTHQWNRTQRQVRSSLSFGVQCLIYPFFQFLKHQPWLTPTLKEQIHRQGQHLRASTPPPPSVDEPLNSVLASLEFEWLAPSPSSLQPSGECTHNKPYPDRFQPLAWAQRLGRVFIRWIRRTEPQPMVIQLDSSRPMAGMPQTHALLPAVDPTPLAPLATIKGSIQGIACQLGDRQLVLVNTANQVLALLSPEQQQILHHRIFWQVARYYQQRRKWLRRWQLPGPSGSPLGCNGATQGTAKSLPPSLWERFVLWLSGLRLPTPQGTFASSSLPISSLSPGVSILAPQGEFTPGKLAMTGPESIEWTTPSEMGLSHITPSFAGLGVGIATTHPTQEMAAKHRDYEDQLIIDIEAAFMGYDLHWLEKCLLWCDRWLTRLEQTLEWFIQGVIQFILRMFR